MAANYTISNKNYAETTAKQFKFWKYMPHIIA